PLSYLMYSRTAFILSSYENTDYLLQIVVQVFVRTPFTTTGIAISMGAVVRIFSLMLSDRPFKK
ncbi:MAG: hypothetical protein PF508_07485, partial [Spirochaeta sp.]|nr:hypothetical protein [Spirochaeta sp.]